MRLFNSHIMVKKTLNMKINFVTNDKRRNVNRKIERQRIIPRESNPNDA